MENWAKDPAVLQQYVHTPTNLIQVASGDGQGPSGPQHEQISDSTPLNGPGALGMCYLSQL